MPSIRIALAQTAPLSAPSGPPALDKPHSSSPFPTLDYNLLQAARYVELASSQSADVVVFPEYFLQGVVNESRQYLSFPSYHLLNFMKELAKSLGVAIVGSIVHGNLPETAHGAPSPSLSPFDHLSHSKPGAKITPGQLAWAKFLQEYPQTAEENAAPTLRNTAFFLEGGTGEGLGAYVKRNLWHPERDYITAGEEAHRVFQTRWGRAGLLICWDMSHPSAAQALAEQGADLIFVPTYWLATDSEPLLHNHAHQQGYELAMVQSICFARSFETETIWVMANAGGDGLEGFMGGSGVWAPLRGQVKSCGTEAELATVDVDVGVLKDARATYKIREDWSRREAS